MAEARLVLQDTGRLIAALERKAHLLGDVCGTDHAGVNCKRHDAVNLQLACQGKHGFLVDDAHVVILVAVAVGDVVGQVVDRDDVDAMAVGRLNHRQQVA